ncbi:acyl carrier protein [Streptomyces sp. NPDC056883]|uniref:acyl carrier protein n=1 Tax=Streptomyces sp. NPDC056883 TaxID=3345959 RepID=UPI0036A77214
MASVEETQATDASDEGEPLTPEEERLVDQAWDVIAAVLGRDGDDLELDSRLAEDLDADDMAVTNIASALELELGVDGLIDEVADWTTVDDVLDSVLYCAEDITAANGTATA